MENDLDITDDTDYAAFLRPATRYTGLQACGLEAQSAELAIKGESLEKDFWKPWNKFTSASSYCIRIDALDESLHRALLPKRDPVTGHKTANLNPYRGWLLNRILRQSLDQFGKRRQKKTNTFAYTLPVGLDRVIDDLAFYARNRGKQDHGITAFQSLNAFAAHVSMLRDAGPRSHNALHHLPDQGQILRP